MLQEPIKETIPYKNEASFEEKYSFFDTKFKITTDSMELIDRFSQIYRRFRIPLEEKTDLCISVITSKYQADTPFLAIGEEKYRLMDEELIAENAFMAIIEKIVNKVKSHYIFHGCAVSFNEKGIMIIAPSSYGKTSLASKLVEKGFNFIAEEFVGLNRVTGMIDPFPRALGIRTNNKGSFEKSFIDVADIYDHISKSCFPQYVIFLGNPLRAGEQKNYRRNLVEVILKEPDKEFVSGLNKLKDVRIISTALLKEHPVFTLSIKRDKGLINEFQLFSKRFKNLILFMGKIPDGPPDFNGPAFLSPVTKSEACGLLLENLRNMNPQSHLLQDFENKPSLLLFKLIEIISETECYKLKQGNLDEMAELVYSLFRN